MSIKSAINLLSLEIGDCVTTSHAIRDQHSHNESHFDIALPDAVVFPRDTSEISTVLRVCTQEKCPVTAWGAGTALEGQHLPTAGGISLDLTTMNSILAVNQEDMDAVVQAGVTREQLNQDLRSQGLFFSVDPGANASIGGMASTRASGTTAMRYGTMRDNIKSLKVVLADGRIVHTGSRARKSASGLDLTSLMIGSEGTLGIISELVVKLHGTPEAISAACCSFDTVENAVATVVKTIQMGVPVARMELVDTNYIQAINLRHDMELPLKPHLFMEFHGSEASVQEQAATVASIAQEFSGSEFEWKIKAEDRNLLWKARHGAYEALASAYPGRLPFATDVCVPISHLAEMVSLAREDIDRSGLPAGIIGHVGDGNFHAQLMIRDGDVEDLRIAKNLSNDMARRAIDIGGTVTGEHGIGMGKIELLQTEHGEAVSVMRGIKDYLDPQNILNPGKLYP